MRALVTILALGAVALAFAPAARADEEPAPRHGRCAPPHGDAHGEHAHGDHGAAAHGEHGAAAHGEHGAAAHGAAAHGDDHPISLDDFNWYYGLIAEKEGVEPGLWF